MRSQFIRIFIAIIFSTIIWFSTELWYSTQNKYLGKSKKQTQAIATLQKHKNEVQRKPVARVIWQDLSSNEILYSGESIRTSADSYAQIVFNDNKTTVDLEPQSMIVIEAASDGLSLNYIEGQVVVENSTNLKVKANNQTINISKANLSLSKGSDNNINLDVFSGQATVQDKAGRSIKLDSKTSGTISDQGIKTEKKLLQILYPENTQTLSLHPNLNKNILIKWQAIAKLTNVQLLMGKDRKTLRPTPYQLVKNGLMTKFSNGKIYWKITGQYKNTSLESKVYQNTVNYLLPPAFIHPTQEAQITISQNSNVYTSWVNPGAMDKLYLEVSTDPEFKKPFIKQYLNKEDSTQSLNIDKKGIYYARITGFTQVNKNWEALRSSITKFYIIEPTVLRSPKLLFPKNKYLTNSAQIFKNKFSFEWQPEKISKKYELIIKDNNSNKIQKFQTEKTKFILNDINPGSYDWTVISLNEDLSSAYDVWFSFDVEDKSIGLNWAVGSSNVLWHSTPEANIELKWKPLSAKNINYEISWENQRTQQTQDWVKTERSNSHNLLLPSDDKYSFKLRGLNSKSKVVAMSPVLNKVVRLLPLPSEPVILPEDSSVIQSNASGEVYINWTNIAKAKEYELSLLNESGEVVNSTKTVNNEQTLKNLKPGVYKVIVKSIDKYNRSSLKTAEKSINVPDLSGITPPKLKGINVQ